MSTLLVGSKEGHSMKYKESPTVVESSFRLGNYFFALETLLEGNVPRNALVILPNSGWISYCIGNASSNGYGTFVHVDEKFHYIYG